jgi:hypothetical protein
MPGLSATSALGLTAKKVSWRDASLTRCGPRDTNRPAKAVTLRSDSFLCYRPVTKTLSAPRDTSDRVCAVKEWRSTWETGFCSYFIAIFPPVRFRTPGENPLGRGRPGAFVLCFIPPNNHSDNDFPRRLRRTVSVIKHPFPLRKPSFYPLNYGTGKSRNNTRIE